MSLGIVKTCYCSACCTSRAQAEYFEKAVAMRIAYEATEGDDRAKLQEYLDFCKNYGVTRRDATLEALRRLYGDEG
jgi:hypothetical protein